VPQHTGTTIALHHTNHSLRRHLKPMPVCLCGKLVDETWPLKWCKVLEK
jgi:hypothetical protein